MKKCDCEADLQVCAFYFEIEPRGFNTKDKTKITSYQAICYACLQKFTLPTYLKNTYNKSCIMCYLRKHVANQF